MLVFTMGRYLKAYDDCMSSICSLFCSAFGLLQHLREISTYFAGVCPTLCTSWILTSVCCMVLCMYSTVRLLWLFPRKCRNKQNRSREQTKQNQTIAEKKDQSVSQKCKDLKS